VSPFLIELKGRIVEEWFQEFDQQSGHIAEEEIVIQAK
jgi:hypothetical protein